MAEKFKKRMSSRAQERLNRAVRTFDLTMIALLIVTIVCGVFSYLRGADLKPGASSGFAYWFLVVVAYLPMMVINLFRTLCQLPVPAPGEHTELYLHGIVAFALETGLWVAIRTAGKRNTKSPLLHISTRVAQIFLCWGVFQLGCMSIAIGVNRGGRASVKTAVTAKPAQK